MLRDLKLASGAMSSQSDRFILMPRLTSFGILVVINLYNELEDPMLSKFISLIS